MITRRGQPDGVLGGRSGTDPAATDLTERFAQADDRLRDRL